MIQLGRIFNEQVVKFSFTASDAAGGKANFSDTLEVGDLKILINGADSADPDSVSNPATGRYLCQWTATGLKTGDVVEFVVEPDTETVDGQAVTAVIARGEGVKSGWADKVFFDVGGAETTDDYPAGSAPDMSINVINEALKIIKNKAKGATLMFKGDGSVIAPTEALTGVRIVGQGGIRDLISLASVAGNAYTGAHLEKLYVSGMNGGSTIFAYLLKCIIETCRAYNSTVHEDCEYLGDVNVYGAGSPTYNSTHFKNPRFPLATSIFTDNATVNQKIYIVGGKGNLDINGEVAGVNPRAFYIYGFTGKLTISNMKAGDSVFLYGIRGEVRFYASCTNGTCILSGNGSVQDASGGSFSVDKTRFLDNADIDAKLVQIDAVVDANKIDLTAIRGKTDNITVTGGFVECDLKAIGGATNKLTAFSNAISVANNTLDANVGLILGSSAKAGGLFNAIDDSNNRIFSDMKAVDSGTAQAAALKNAIDTGNNLIKSNLYRVVDIAVQHGSGYLHVRNESGNKISEFSQISGLLTRAQYVDFFTRDVTGRTVKGNPSQYKIGTSSNQEIIDVTYTTIDEAEKVETETPQ